MTIRRFAATMLVGTIAAGLAATATQAQSAQPLSLQGSLLLASQKIGTKAVNGVGFEGQFRYTHAMWSVGLGYQFSSHKTGDDKIDISGVFLEPRYAINIHSDRIAPYIAARLAFLKESLSLAAQPDDDFSSNGSAFGGGGGVLVVLTSVLNADFGVAFVRQSFSDASSGLTTVKFPGFTGYVAKGGLSFGFGGSK